MVTAPALTPEQLATWRKEAEEATPGPWIWDLADDGGIEAERGGFVCQIQPHGSIHTVERTGQQYKHADAAFIASARTAVPRLIDYVEALRKYAEHLLDCETQHPEWLNARGQCTCGLDELFGGK